MPKSFDHWKWKFIPHADDFIPREQEYAPNKRSKTGIVQDPPPPPVVNIGPYHEYRFEWPRGPDGKVLPKDEWPQEYQIIFGLKDTEKPNYFNGLGVTGTVPSDPSGVYRDPILEINPTYTISSVDPQTLVFTPIGDSASTLAGSEAQAVTLPVTQGTPKVFSFSTPANNARYTHSWTNVTLNPPSAGLGSIAATSVSGNNFGLTVSPTAASGTMRVIGQYNLTDLTTGLVQQRVFTMDFVITPASVGGNLGVQRSYTISDPKPIFGQVQITHKIINVGNTTSEPGTNNGPNTVWTSGLGQHFISVNAGGIFRAPGQTTEIARVPFYIGTDGNNYNKIRFTYVNEARTLSYNLQLTYPDSTLSPQTLVAPADTFTEFNLTGKYGTATGYRLLNLRVTNIPDGDDQRLKIEGFDTQTKQGETILTGRWAPGFPEEGNAFNVTLNEPYNEVSSSGAIFFPNGLNEVDVTLPLPAATPGKFTGFKVAQNGALQWWHWTNQTWDDCFGSNVGAGDDKDIFWINGVYIQNNKFRVRRRPGKQGGIDFVTWGYNAAL